MPAAEGARVHQAQAIHLERQVPVLMPQYLMDSPSRRYISGSRPVVAPEVAEEDDLEMQSFPCVQEDGDYLSRFEKQLPPSSRHKQYVGGMLSSKHR
jgi:hypothetical protein